MMKTRFYKKIYSHGDFYKSLVLMFRSIKHVRINRKKKLVSPQFKERIMLAVTEVNGCEACSYMHTKLALEEGLSTQEINDILGGELAGIPDQERVGILFAQHYADQKGKASKKSWQRLIDEYGREHAMVILAMARVIQVGNIYGMAVSAIRDRFRGKPSGKTSLIYELSIIVLVFLYLPIAGIQALIEKIRRKTLDPF
jgi:AhpD family alkylhydroperoxidase